MFAVLSFVCLLQLSQMLVEIKKTYFWRKAGGHNIVVLAEFGIVLFGKLFPAEFIKSHFEVLAVGFRFLDQQPSMREK